MRVCARREPRARGSDADVFLDTNGLIRRLTGDPPEMAARATKALAGADELLLAALIVAQSGFVLESFYAVPRERRLAIAISRCGSRAHC